MVSTVGDYLRFAEMLLQVVLEAVFVSCRHLL